jgi:hypothetical protein
MDLFPDWSEIELKVKLLMVGLHALATLLMCALVFTVGRNWSSRRRAWTLLLLSGAVGSGLFVSMFLFDWAEILPPYHKAWVTTQQSPKGQTL